MRTLITLILLLPFSVSAQKHEPLPLQDCMMKVLTKQGRDLNWLRKHRGDLAIKREINKYIRSATPGKYDKHIQAPKNATPDQVKTLSLKTTHAQFFPHIKRESLERRVLFEMEGYNVAHGSTYFKYVKLDNPIGYDMGKEARWVRVELTSGKIFHGQPVSDDRMRKLCAECLK